MELKEFIKGTLIQITEAVVEAEEVCSKNGANVNPLLSEDKEIAMTAYGNSVSMVKFHVGLCESKDASDKRGIGVFLANIGIGYSGNEGQKVDSMTTIDFSIPIKLPYSATGEGRVFSNG